jgi:hypothetical protein
MDTNILGSERGLTFWRPRPPIGYVSLGDCVTTGTMQPTFQVDPIITIVCHTSLKYVLRTLLNWLFISIIAMEWQSTILMHLLSTKRDSTQL